jgi:outer membrane protein assembly factor BamB
MMRTILILTFVVVCGGAVRGDNWPQWRGPTFNGVAQGVGFPVQWSQTDNIAWRFDLPGPGASTPAVWDDHIFLTCAVGDKNALLCLDRSGRLRWRVELGVQRPGKNKKGTGSNPSPTTDGKHVWAYFKSGDLACVSFAGRIVWHKNLQKFYGQDTLWWDLGTSPVLTRNCVVVACIHSGPSYLVAFDKETGNLAWKVGRDLDAPEEAAQSYSTPVPSSDNGKDLLIVLGADHVTAHIAETGEELWRVGGLNPAGNKYFRSIASPVVSDGFVIAPYARGETLIAIRLGGRGDVTHTHIAWTKSGVSSDVPTPAATSGRIYVCKDRGEIACLDVATGKTIWSRFLEKNRNAFSASPILADGRIYVTREDGTTFVLEQRDEFKLLAANRLNEFTVATPVFTRGQILIRTLDHLYCVGLPTN